MSYTALLEEGDPATDGRLFRRCLGEWGTGIAIITTEHEGRKFAVTVNSFASVSLDPPLLLWSINKTSRSRPAFEAASGFVVNILARDQMDLSRHFSSSVEDKFATVSVSQGVTGFPMIDGALAQFECHVDAMHEGGDHIIMVGRVVHARRYRTDPLMFLQGRYVVHSEHPDANPAPQTNSDIKTSTAAQQETRLIQRIFDAHNALSRKFEEHRVAEDMTMAVARTLTTLSPDQPMANDALERKTYLGARVTQETLQALSAEGSVTQDSTGNWILTERGVKRRDAIYNRWLKFQDEQLHHIQQSDIAAALNTLNAVAE